MTHVLMPTEGKTYADGATICVFTTQVMTNEKWDSLGKRMTLKDALDLWWSSIDVHNTESEYHYPCFRNRETGEYETGGIPLETEIELTNYFECDAGGRPFIWAKIVKNN